MGVIFSSLIKPFKFDEKFGGGTILLSQTVQNILRLYEQPVYVTTALRHYKILDSGKQLNVR